MHIKQLTLALIVLGTIANAEANCIVYTDTHFTGKSMDLTNGTEIPRLSDTFDDNISSVVITGGSVLEGWDWVNYRQADGGKFVFADNIERISDEIGNNKISSLKCIGSTPTLRTPLDPHPIGKPLPYGPDTCKQGYVWREAYPNDHVCVIPASREQAKADNALRTSRMASPHAKSDNDNCVMGYVWREANATDHVCVTSDIRERTKQENANASNNKVRP